MAKKSKNSDVLAKRLIVSGVIIFIFTFVANVFAIYMIQGVFNWNQTLGTVISITFAMVIGEYIGMKWMV
ncbi:MAG: hypothetical protein PHW96_00965 [Candidatus Nanoarchaeia archaeon]|nr:hypothetical protein [Candidatus Nanoarchaeia archaeon]